MSRSQAFMCKTPLEHCTGFTVPDITHGCHTTRSEAFDCTKRYYLDELGWDQAGPREFRKTEGGILVMDKSSRFGGRLKRGKENRLMLDRKHGSVF